VQLTVAYGNAGPGITLERTTDFDLISNTVEANGAEGILLDSITRSTLAFNEITMNGLQGIRVSNAPDAPSQLAIRQNLIADNHAEGILIDSALDAIVDGNTISRNLLSGLVLGRGVGRQTVVARNAIVENGLGGSIEPFRSGVVLRSDRPVVVGPGNLIARNSLIGILVLRDFAAPASVPHLITGNVITGNRWYGILIEALSIVGFWSPNDVRITENRVFRNGFTGIVATFARGTVVGPGNVIEGNRVSGIWLHQTTGSLVTGNLVRGNGVGVDVEGASGDRIQGNTIIGSGFQGVRVFASTGLVLSSNTIASSGGWNVYADRLLRSQFCGNTIRNANSAGLYMIASHGNFVCRNKITGNGAWGAQLLGSTMNTIVQNDFVGNAVNAYDDGSNAWYVPCVGGNYWSDISLGVDKRDNCLGLPFPDGRWWDAPYLIAGGPNMDRFPWKFPVA
jgi:parallel beta-helix repeat protein